MITEKKRLGLNIISFAFEAPHVVQERIANKKYDSITVFSYEKLDLPGFHLARTKTTPIIDVQGKTIEEISANFSKTTRNEINRTLRMPELSFKTVRSREEKDDWYALYTDFEIAQHRPPMSYKDFLGLTLFGAWLHGEPASAVVCVVTSSLLRVHSIFSKRLTAVSDQKTYNMIGYAGKRVMFEAIQFAIKEGCSGVDLAYASTKKSGISNYKMSFGGTLVPEYRYEHKTALYSFINHFAYWWGIVKWLRDVVVNAFFKKEKYES